MILVQWKGLTLHQNYLTHSWNLWVNNQLVALNCGCHTAATAGTTTYVAWWQFPGDSHSQSSHRAEGCLS